MQNCESNQHKTRRPIFPKKQISQYLDNHSNLNKTTSYVHISRTDNSPMNTHHNSRVYAYPIPNRQNPSKSIIHDLTHQRGKSQGGFNQFVNYEHHNLNSQISQISNPQSQILIRTQPLPFYDPRVGSQPQLHRQTVYQQNVRPILNSFEQPQFQTIRFSHQNSSKQLNKTYGNCIRADRLKPTVIAVERVMKPIVQNGINSQTVFLKPNSVVYSASPPKQILRESVINHQVLVEQTKNKQMTKLSQINSILSNNYEQLCDEFYNLKSNIEQNITQRQFVEEGVFLKRSVNQIDAIFKVNTAETLNKIDQIYRMSKNKQNNHPNKLKKSRF